MESNKYLHGEKRRTMPIDNSKMFGRMFLFTGRIGVKEYRRTLYIGNVSFFVGLMVLPMLFAIVLPWWISTEWKLGLGVTVCFVYNVYLRYAATSKRMNDLGNPRRSLFTMWHGLDLYNEPGVEGVNEHGSNPAQPYDEQVDLANL